MEEGNRPDIGTLGSGEGSEQPTPVWCPVYGYPSSTVQLLARRPRSPSWVVHPVAPSTQEQLKPDGLLVVLTWKHSRAESIDQGYSLRASRTLRRKANRISSALIPCRRGSAPKVVVQSRLWVQGLGAD
jgi:hypothetical protein